MWATVHPYITQHRIYSVGNSAFVDSAIIAPSREGNWSHIQRSCVEQEPNIKIWESSHNHVIRKSSAYSAL